LSEDVEYVKEMFGKLNGGIIFSKLLWHHDKRWLNNLYSEILTSSSKIVRFAPAVDVIFVKNPYGDSRPFPITLSHYPMAQWEASHYGAWNLHGHSHGNHVNISGDRIMDVGVDCNGYAPVSFDSVLKYMNSI